MIQNKYRLNTESSFFASKILKFYDDSVLMNNK